MQEKQQQLVWIIYLVFFAIIFEGAFRKWLFPFHHSYFFFMRDPFVITAYFFTLYHGLLKKQGLLFHCIILFTATITIFSFFQTLYSHLPWWIIAYSWRTHFLMLPLAIIIGVFLKSEHIKKMFVFCLRITPAYVFIVYFQSVNKVDHWINSGFAGYFRPLSTTGGLVRTEGLFTSSVGNAIFVGMLMAVLISFLFKDDYAAILSKSEKLIYTICIITILVLSGQRTTYILATSVILSGFAGSMLTNRTTMRNFVKPAATVFILSLLFLQLFPAHKQAIYMRFAEPNRTGDLPGSDLVDRVINDLTGFYREFAGKIPLMGLGIGYSSNAARVYNVSYIDVYSESEWGRHMIELGPVFGFIIICFRIFVFIYLGALSLSCCIKNKDPVPIMFFTLLGSFLLFGQLTGNGIASGFIWFLTGINLALLKDPNGDSQSTQTA